MADPDLEPRGGGDGGFVLLALPAFLPSVISSFIYPLNLNPLNVCLIDHRINCYYLAY